MQETAAATLESLETEASVRRVALVNEEFLLRELIEWRLAGEQLAARRAPTPARKD